MACLVFSTYFITEKLWAMEHLGPQLINHNVRIGHQRVKRGRFYRFSLCFWFIFDLTKRPIKSENIVKHDKVSIKLYLFITWFLLVFELLCKNCWKPSFQRSHLFKWFVIQKMWLFDSDVTPRAILSLTVVLARWRDRILQLQETCTFIFNLVSLILNSWGGWKNPHPHLLHQHPVCFKRERGGLVQD